MLITPSELAGLLGSAFHMEVDATRIAVLGVDNAIEAAGELGIHIVPHPSNGLIAMLGSNPVLAKHKALAFRAYLKEVTDDH